MVVWQGEDWAWNVMSIRNNMHHNQETQLKMMLQILAQVRPTKGVKDFFKWWKDGEGFNVKSS